MEEEGGKWEVLPPSKETEEMRLKGAEWEWGEEKEEEEDEEGGGE